MVVLIAVIIIIKAITDKKGDRGGSFEVCYSHANCCVKIIRVAPLSRISLQYHNHREELWTILSGTARVQLDDTDFLCNPFDQVTVARQQVHRLTNTSDSEELVVLEIQKGDQCEEGDIVRIQDDYKRLID